MLVSVRGSGVPFHDLALNNAFFHPEAMNPSLSSL